MVDHKTIARYRDEQQSTGEIPQLKTTVGTDKTIGTYRQELEGNAEIPQSSTVQTSDGRSYPSKRKPKPEPEPEPGRSDRPLLSSAPGCRGGRVRSAR